MGLRDRLKNKLTSNKSGDNTPSGSSTPKSNNKVETYKPGEEPKPKYRGRIDKEHTDKLQAFTFSDAWSSRRKSSNGLSGIMSPGGTKSQSRRASWMSSMRSKSVGASSDTDSKSLGRVKSAATQQPETVKENEVDDTDAANAGLSRPQTSSGKPQPANLEADTDTPMANGEKKIEPNEHIEPKPDNPFTTEELERALTKATIKAPQEEGALGA